MASSEAPTKAKSPAGTGAAANVCEHHVDLFRHFLFLEAAGSPRWDGWHFRTRGTSGRTAWSWWQISWNGEEGDLNLDLSITPNEQKLNQRAQKN